MTTTPTPPLDSERLLWAIARAQSSFIQEESLSVVMDGLLQQLLELTGSEYGFIGERLIDDGGQPYLRTLAITNIAWTDELNAFYEAHAPTGLEFRNLENLFGRVLTTQQPLLSNDPAHDPRRGGLPPGHPALNHFLGLPIHTGQEMVGMVGIANRPGGYDQEVADYLAPFTATCANLVLAVKTRREREETEQAQRDFVAVVSHELRTPMTLIRGSLDLLHGLYADDIPEPAQELLDHAVDGSGRMLRLLDDLLQIDRLDGDRVKLHVEECDVNTVLSQVIGHHRAHAASRDVCLVLDVLGRPRVQADTDRLSQVITNLVANAVKFSPPSEEVLIRSRVHEDTVSIEVCDRGPGIAHEAQVQIFEKFRQATPPETRNADGLGLGLYVVKALVERHGGSVHVVSEPGRGATFTVRLPKTASEGGA